MTVGSFFRHHLYYGNRPRRAARRLQRYVRGVATLSNYPRGRSVSAFWFDQFQNFGDALTPWLLGHAGYLPRLSTAADAQLVGVGSILELVPEDFEGAVWGSGLLYGRPLTRPRATWLAVRGHLTRGLVGAPDATVLGDPGLLASRFVPQRPPKWSLGIVPHHAQRDLEIWQEVQRSVPGSVLIDPVRRPADVLRRIAGCNAVLTSSLHGLITADSYGIPAAWLEFPDRPLRGGDFKFRDHESVVMPTGLRRCDAHDAAGVVKELRARSATPDPRVVEQVQRELLGALSSAPHTALSPLRSF